MLKLFFIIDCDICGESLKRIATSTDRNPSVWGYQILDLEMTSDNYGWCRDTKHYCPSCIRDMEFYLPG